MTRLFVLVLLASVVMLATGCAAAWQAAGLAARLTSGVSNVLKKGAPAPGAAVQPASQPALLAE